MCSDWSFYIDIIGVQSVSSAAKDLDRLVRAYNPPVKELAQRLRVLVKKTLPDAVETVKWGNLMYILDGKNLAWIVEYKDHVDLGFFVGAKLNSKLLEGTGKGIRHIKFMSERDVDEAEFTRLLRQAAKLT